METLSKQENYEGGNPKKRLIIGIVVIVLVAAVAIGGAQLLKVLNGSNTPPTTDVPVTLSGPSQQTVIVTDEHGNPVTDESGNTVTDTNSGHEGTDAPQLLTKRDGLYTFLVVGLDQSKALSDVIILVTFDTNADTLNCLSIPRDTYSKANNRNSNLKHINLAYGSGGIEQLKTELLSLVGYSVDRHVIVDMNAFVKIINYIGGVNFTVPQDMNYDDPTQDLHIHLKKGYQTLSGADALKLMRYRSYASADIGRISVRHDFLKALASQLLSGKSATKAVEIAGTVFDNVTTDMSLDDLTWFAKQAIELNADDISFYTLPGGPAQGSGMWIPYPKASLEMINTYLNPYNQDIIHLDMVSRAENEGK